LTNNQGFFYIINIKNNNFSEDGEMKIYVVGSSKNKFLPLDDIREKFLIDQPHEGDNIDFLNPWYCELTGLYYLWKHVDDEIVGLEHYRRYFVNNRGRLLSENEIKKELEVYDILCIKSPGYSKRFPVINWFIKNNKLADIKKFLIFAKAYVNENYYNECWKILNSDHHAMCNMFICKKELIDEYCEFIFDLTTNYMEAEKYYNRKLPKRILGYFTEFLFEAWLKIHNKKYKFQKLKFCK